MALSVASVSIAGGIAAKMLAVLPVHALSFSCWHEGARLFLLEAC